MTTRRNFIKTTAIAATAAATIPEILRANVPAKPTAARSPLVIATWNNAKATEAGWLAMEKGGTALDAVEQGGRVPEADPNDQSVGYGGRPDRDGHVTLDACVMDHKGNAGAVTFLEHIMHPVTVARRVMEKTPHVMLSGEGALQFALSEGFKKENLLTEQSKKEWQEWLKTAQYKPIVNIENHDTIGLLALDKDNHLSAACTTSGLAYKMRGRVGDSPIIGAGVFVDDEIGGACATGLGEFVMKTLGSFLVVELMRQGRTPQQACEEAVMRIVKRYPNYKDFQVGYLAVDKKGNYGAYAIQKGFTYALYVDGVNKVYDAGSYIQ